MLTRVLYFAAGCLAVALGALGVILPVLPTTPFLLVAAFCFARSSRRAHDWLLNNRVFGRFLRDYLEGTPVSAWVRAGALVFMWATIAASVVFFVPVLWGRLLLLMTGAAVSVHVIMLGRSIRTNRAAGAVISALSYVVAIVVAVLVVRVTGLAGALEQTALGTLVATVVIFAASVALNNSSMYDPYWSLQPLALAGYYIWIGWGSITDRQILVTLLVLLYAVRLTSNFYRDWPGLTKEDFRYVGFRSSSGRLYWPVSFLGIHLFPTIMVFLGCLPMYGVSREHESPLGWLDGVAAIVVLGAIGLALVSDEQLRRFRKDPSNRDGCIRAGLWAYSRHPNYLGEITTWWGLWLFALAASPRSWWTVIGAAAITLMFVFASVPMMEKRALATRPCYREYRDRTPMLLPGPRRRGSAPDAK